MEKEEMPESTKFRFVLNTEQTMANLDQLKLVNYPKFNHINKLGALLQSFAKNDDWASIEKTTEADTTVIPFLKLEIEDAFISALNLRNHDTVLYFLKNGIALKEIAEDAPLTVCYSLQYLRGEEIPIDLLKLVLKYGGNPRKASDRDSQTPLHLASQYGCLPFIEVLLQHGADINAANDDRETPLGTAIRYKQQSAVALLKQKGANERWNS